MHGRLPVEVPLILDSRHTPLKVITPHLPNHAVNIALVGKYTALPDSKHLSVLFIDYSPLW